MCANLLAAADSYEYKPDGTDNSLQLKDYQESCEYTVNESITAFIFVN